MPYSAWVGSHVGHAGVAYINACGESAGDPSLLQSAVSGLTIGTNYMLSWDFIRDNLGTQGKALDSFLVEILGIPGSPFGFDYANNSAWQTQSVSFIATATSHSIRFSTEANDSDASYYLDNVNLANVNLGNVNLVSEPFSLALVGLGLLGVGLSRRKPVAQ